MRVAAGFAALFLACSAAGAWAQGLTAEEEAGKRIFFEGIGASGIPIQAKVGPTGTQVSGETLPCATCHGPDGLGRPEGAVKPSNITWPELTKSYGHRHENGREHGPFDEGKFSESLTFGTDPAGNKLDSSMPRYVMANSDIAALTAYIKRMAADLDPGIRADSLRIGTLLPGKGRQAELGAAMAGMLKAHVEALNAQGGIFGRKLELVTAEYPEEPGAAAAAVKRLMQDEGVFALVSPYAGGIEREMAALAEATRVPVVGPLTPLPDTNLAVNRYTFYLLPGLREQGRALVDFAVKDLKLSAPVSALVYPETPGGTDLADALASELKERGWSQVHRAAYAAGNFPAVKIVADMQQRGVQVIFFLGSDVELESLGKQVRDAIWSPYLLAPGGRVGRAAVNLPTTFGNRVYLAYPTLPADVSPQAGSAIGAMQKKHGMGMKQLPAQFSAYGAMRVLEEGLKRAGRDLSRARFVAALENLFSFESGVMPSISYGPNRRIGALGAHIVAVDLGSHQFKPTGRYIRLD